MRAQKAVAIDVFVELHGLHFSRSVIAKLTGYFAAYVGEVPFDVLKRERWDNVADVRAALPSALRESCARLMAARRIAPRERADRCQDISPTI
jgi:hypothetical protein